MTGSIEILTLSGTVAVGGNKTASHMHMAISTTTGQVLDAHIGYDELVMRVRS